MSDPLMPEETITERMAKDGELWRQGVEAGQDELRVAGWVSPVDVARIKAEAWDEGHMDGYWDAEHEQMIQRGVRRRTDNPYRAALNQGGETNGD